MTSRAYAGVVVLWVVAAALAVAWRLPRAEIAGPNGADALPTEIREQDAAASLGTGDTLPTDLAAVTIEPVQGEWRGPGERDFYVALRTGSEGSYRYRPFGRAVFDVTLRLDESTMSQEPCTSCHQGQEPARGRADGEGVHQNIQPLHPAQTGAQCRTCHDDDDVSRLGLEGGGTVSLDHAYRVCAQCHFRQVESWAYGAHGKRLVGWSGRRVVMGCADCHDPHRPATETRPPMAGLSLPGALIAEEGGAGAHGEGEAEPPGGRRD